MTNQFMTRPKNWLAFELNVLRRIEFSSAALPFTVSPVLGSYLKRREVRVHSNDLLQSAWNNAVAVIQNNSLKLSDDDVNVVLEDVYVPRHRLQNPSLRNWFNETDSWWFDNLRQNIDKLESPFTFAIAASLGMAVGDYVRTFRDDTLELRQPLSNVFRRLLSVLPEPVNNGQNNTAQNKTPNEFIAECTAELMFLTLPAAGAGNPRNYSQNAVWREEWLRGGDDFWTGVAASQNGKLGMTVETKSQYLRLLEDLLITAKHIRTWAISHIEGGFVTTQDIVETVGKVRKVEAIYTKDFSELAGTKAVIITA
jgi:adenine-specific DNA-methyltransferase